MNRNKKGRLDESFSCKAFWKCLTRNSAVTVDWNKIKVSEDGEIEPCSSEEGKEYGKGIG